MTTMADPQWLSLTRDETETRLWAHDNAIPYDRVSHVPDLLALVRTLMGRDLSNLAVHRSRAFYRRHDAQAIEDGLNRKLEMFGRQRLSPFPADASILSLDSCPHDGPCDCWIR